jgi:hypothetical protein
LLAAGEAVRSILPVYVGRAETVAVTALADFAMTAVPEASMSVGCAVTALGAVVVEGATTAAGTADKLAVKLPDPPATPRVVLTPETISDAGVKTTFVPTPTVAALVNVTGTKIVEPSVDKVTVPSTPLPTEPTFTSVPAKAELAGAEAKVAPFESR